MQSFIQTRNYLLFFVLIIFSGCQTTRPVYTDNLEALELWMITHSKEIKKRTTLSGFRIALPGLYYKDKWLLNLTDSLKTPAVQLLNANNDRFMDLIVSTNKEPYLILNARKPKILNLQRNNFKEVFAIANPEKEKSITIYEAGHSWTGDTIKTYNLVLWNDRLIEQIPRPDYEITAFSYVALGYEKRILNIDMEGAITFFEYSGKFDEHRSDSVYIKKGKANRKDLALLRNFLLQVNLKKINPEPLDMLHIQEVHLVFTTRSGTFELKDNGKIGAFALIALYDLIDQIIASADFKIVKSYELKQLYVEGLDEVFKTFNIKH